MPDSHAPGRLTAAELIKALQLTPHPEGGHYHETYRAQELVVTPRGPRAASTAILFLLAAGEHSCWHRIGSDELWHHHGGGGLVIHELAPGGQTRSTRLGLNLAAGEVPQLMVPAGHWFAAELVAGCTWSLVGCTVAPGFDFADFELARAEQLESHAGPLGESCPHWRQLLSSR